MKVSIIVAMHKSYECPESKLYLPLHVGAFSKKSISAGDRVVIRDDTGDSISEKNPYYCELTGLYWAWKNLQDDAIGLVHYRRYFSNKGRFFRKNGRVFAGVLTEVEADMMLKAYDIVIPNKRKYYIETLYSHYSNTLDGSHLDIAREIVAKKYADFLPYVDKAYKSRFGYMFNMAIMKRKYLDEYCSIIFDILEEMELRIDASKLDAFSARLFGRVSEILFTAYVFSKQSEGVPIIECRTIDIEPVNWPKKIGGFLAAKFFGKKYSKSM